MPERPEAEKFTHKEVGYENPSTRYGEMCGNCSMFINRTPPRCTIVKEPIFRGGWCRKWEED